MATDARPRVLCMSDLDDAPEAVDLLRAETDFDLMPADGDRLMEIIPHYDAFYGHVDLKLDRAFFERAEGLRAVASSSTGTDHIDRAAAADHGVRVLCIKEDYGLLDRFTATAECAWMLMLTSARHFRRATDFALGGGWGHQGLVGTQFLEKTLGVLGVGRLGTMTARFGNGFGMRVLGCDLRPMDPPGVEMVSFDRLLAESDFLSIHVHMTPENHHLFDAKAFAAMKPGAVLVNTSRGDVIDEAALIDALDSGHLAGFGADVLHDEWRDDMGGSPIIQYARTHPNVVITPHIGGATVDSNHEARLFTARKLVHYLQTGDELTFPRG